METGSPLWNALWHIGGFFCHQLPERSPQFMGVVFPLCYRCSGLYLGFLAAFSWILVSGGFSRRLPDVRCLSWMSALALPFFVDGWANVIGLWASAGWVRAMSGAGMGLLLPHVLVPLLHNDDPGTTLKPTVSTPVGLLPGVALGAMLLWLVDHPARLSVFQALAIAASFAPAIFLATFLVAAGRHRTDIARGFTLRRAVFLGKVEPASEIRERWGISSSAIRARTAGSFIG